MRLIIILLMLFAVSCNRDTTNKKGLLRKLDIAQAKLENAIMSKNSVDEQITNIMKLSVAQSPNSDTLPELKKLPELYKKRIEYSTDSLYAAEEIKSIQGDLRMY